MKIKAEYIVLLVVIVGLSLYLMFYQADETNYELPKMPEVKVQDITKITLSHGKKVIELKKKDTKWQIMPEGYPADAEKVKGILDVLGEMTLTALVSETENYQRYELGDNKKTTVTAFAGDTVKRQFDAGKAASSNKHTFVRVSGDKRVYHARGNFKSKLEVSVDDLRDKNIMAFEKDRARELEIKEADTKLAYSMKDVPPETAEEESTETGDASNAPAEPETAWFDSENHRQAKGKITDLLAQVSSVKCDRFLDDRKKEDLKDPLYTMKIVGDKEYTLTIFNKLKEGDNGYPGISSESDYPFVLPEWKVNSIKTKLEALTGKTEEKQG